MSVHRNGAFSSMGVAIVTSFLICGSSWCMHNVGMCAHARTHTHTHTHSLMQSIQFEYQAATYATRQFHLSVILSLMLLLSLTTTVILFHRHMCVFGIWDATFNEWQGWFFCRGTAFGALNF
jgi:hypothetical protein